MAHRCPGDWVAGDCGDDSTISSIWDAPVFCNRITRRESWNTFDYQVVQGHMWPVDDEWMMSLNSWRNDFRSDKLVLPEIRPSRYQVDKMKSVNLSFMLPCWKIFCANSVFPFSCLD